MGNQLVSKIILQISKARSWRWKLKKCKQFTMIQWNMVRGFSIHFILSTQFTHHSLLKWNISREVYITICYKMRQSDFADPHSCKCFAAGTPRCLLCLKKKTEKYFRECLLEKYFLKWFRPPAMRLLGLRRAIPTAVPSFLSFFETNKPSSKRSHQENQTPANYQKWASDVLAMLSVYKKTCIGN